MFFASRRDPTAMERIARDEEQRQQQRDREQMQAEYQLQQRRQPMQATNKQEAQQQDTTLMRIGKGMAAVVNKGRESLPKDKEKKEFHL